MGDFKAPLAQQNKTATAAQAPKEASSLGETEYVDSRASTFQFIQLQSAADDQGKGNRINQLQSKSTQFTRFSQVAQLQAKRDSKISSTQSPVVQREENKTGLPDGLKSGMESISGLSLHDVKVHRNSDKPAQLQAHAYAQGTDIHLGPGQEKHLPHELGHVVQQKEGRVKPTVQLKDKVNINDDSGLEKEADVLGKKAQNFEFNPSTTAQLKSKKTSSSEVIQKAGGGAYAQLGDGPDDVDLQPEQPVNAGPQVTDLDQKEEEGKSMGPLTYKDGKVELNLFDKKYTFTPKNGLVIIDKKYSLKSTSFGCEVDIPIYPGFFAKVGLNIKPTLDLHLSGNANVTPEKEIKMDAELGGSMGVEVEATAALEVGVPCLTTISAGGFGNLKATADFSGKIIGTAGTGAASLNLSMRANTALIGTAGVFLEARAAMLKKKVKYELAKWNFGTFNYQRDLDLSAASKDGWKPVLTDFQKKEYAVSSKSTIPKVDPPDAISEMEESLLGNGERSDGAQPKQGLLSKIKNLF